MKAQHLFVKVDSDAVRQNLDPRYKRVYASVNAAVFAFNQIDSRFKALCRLLIEYDRTRTAEGKKLHAGQVNLDLGYERGNEIVGLAWDVVDWMDRLRKIMGGISGVRKNEAWHRAMLAALKHAESLRHLFQHFDSSLTKFIKGSYPLMGTVIAAFPTANGAYARVLISTPARYAGDQTIHVAGFRFPPCVAEDVTAVTLSVADLYLDISDVHSRISAARTEFAEQLRRQYEFRWPDV